MAIKVANYFQFARSLTQNDIRVLNSRQDNETAEAITWVLPHTVTNLNNDCWEQVRAYYAKYVDSLPIFNMGKNELRQHVNGKQFMAKKSQDGYEMKYFPILLDLCADNETFTLEVSLPDLIFAVNTPPQWAILEILDEASRQVLNIISEPFKYKLEQNNNKKKHNDLSLSLVSFLETLLPMYDVKRQVKNVSAIWRPCHMDLFNPYVLFQMLWRKHHHNTLELHSFFREKLNKPTISYAELKQVYTDLKHTCLVKEMRRNSNNRLFRVHDVLMLKANRQFKWFREEMSVVDTFKKLGLPFPSSTTELHNTHGYHTFVFDYDTEEQMFYWNKYVGIASHVNINPPLLANILGFDKVYIDKILPVEKHKYVLIEGTPTYYDLNFFIKLLKKHLDENKSTRSKFSIKESEARFQKMLQPQVKNWRQTKRESGVTKGRMPCTAIMYKVSASPSFFKDKTKDEIAQFFNDASQALQSYHNNENHILAHILVEDPIMPYLIVIATTIDKSNRLNHKLYFDGVDKFNDKQRGIANMFAWKYGLLAMNSCDNKPFESLEAQIGMPHPIDNENNLEVLRNRIKELEMKLKATNKH